MIKVDDIWYDNLNKSTITPPKIVFPFVWSILYFLIIVSAGMVIWKDRFQNKLAITYFIIQMALNISWTPVFFRLKNIKLSLIVITILWLFILLNIIEFLKISQMAGYLLIPYFVWVSLALYLNSYIYRYN
jgi:tryptophan-rich sensory protein